MHHNFDILTCDPLICTVNHPKFIVSNQMEGIINKHFKGEFPFILQASGDRNNLIHIWNPDTCELLHTFKGHRGAISVSIIDPDKEIL